MSFEIPGVLWRRDPGAAEVPLVFDSPHSGSEYPEDFRFCCSLDILRTAEDAYVDELYAAAPELGATLIGAVFPRSYLDTNRAADDLDTLHIDGIWPTPLSPSHRTRAGLGLVRRVARPGIPIYDRKLTAAEIMARVERCHVPYHRVLQEACDRVHCKFGSVWHVNCHSMPSQRSGKKGGRCAVLCWAIATALPAPRNSPISSPECCGGAATRCASTRFTKGSKSSSGKAVRQPTGTASRSRSTAHFIWTRKRWRRPAASAGCGPTSRSC